MLVDSAALLWRQCARLQQDCIANTDLPDVVQVPADLKLGQRLFVQTQMAGDQD